MFFIDEIDKNTKIAIRNERNRLINVDRVAFVLEGKIYVKKSGLNVEIPEDLIIGFQNNKIEVIFDNKKSYKTFIKREVALSRGNILLSEFEWYLPQAIDHEVYDFSKNLKLSKCNILKENIHYICQKYIHRIFSILAEIDLTIDPNYFFYYSIKKKVFGFAPFSQSNIFSMEEFNISFKRDWMITLQSIFNPVNFICGGEKYQKALRIGGELFKKLLIKFKKTQNEPLEILNDLLIKYHRSLSKRGISFELPITNKELSNIFISLNYNLKKNLGAIIKNFPLKPSTWRKFGDRMLTGAMIAASSVAGGGFVTGATCTQLKVEPIYLIPNGNSTVIVILIPHQPGSLNLFKFYPIVYEFLKEILQILSKKEFTNRNRFESDESNSIESNYCPNCGLSYNLDDNFCVNCGFKLKND